MQSDHLRLLAKVARLYHERGLRQQEIASTLNLSQARVSRLLKEAVEQGIVRSVVVLPDGVYTDLEEAVALAYGLRDVVVVNTEGSGADITQALGSAAAAYLDATLKGGDVIGVSTWSGCLLAAVESMRRKPQAVAERVIQLFGGVGRPEAQVQATRITGRLAQVTGAQPVFVPTPGVVGSAQIQQAMMSDPSVEAVRAQWSDVTVSLVGIGSVSPSPLLQHSGNAFSEVDQDELRKLGAVGDICLRFFGADGLPVASDFDDRVIGIDAGTLRGIPRRVAIAGGHEKKAAIRAALLGGWANVLITDVGVAEELLASAPCST
jgi:DNA-binding transcriptional regulator LsrR (DeoR family)